MAIAIAEVFAAAAGGRWIWMEMEFLPAKLTLTSRFFCRFLIVDTGLYWYYLRSRSSTYAPDSEPMM